MNSTVHGRLAVASMRLSLLLLRRANTAARSAFNAQCRRDEVGLFAWNTVERVLHRASNAACALAHLFAGDRP